MVMLVLALCASFSLSSCSNDDEDENDGDNGGVSKTNLVITVKENGTVSGGHTFDDGVGGFWIDNIRYEINEDHLEITSIVQNPKISYGDVHLPSTVIYKGISYNLTKINSGFYSCKTLTSITIPNFVTTIGPSAFGYCSSLTSITIGKSVTSIDSQAFEFCSSLRHIYLLNTTPPTIPYGTFGYFNPASARLHVPAGTTEKYTTAAGWRDFPDIIDDAKE